MQEWHSVNDIVKSTGLTDSTARRYLKTFHEFLDVEKRSKHWRYSGETVAIIKRVAQLYESKHTSEDIRDILRQEIKIINVPPDDQGQAPVKMQSTLAEHLQEQNAALLTALAKMTEQVTEAVKASHASREELEALKQRINAIEGKKPRKWYEIFKR
jgi:DNA-binding IclR family transcriptional regulator